MRSADARLVPRFGENTFSFASMQEHLPSETYDKLMFAIRNQRPISPEIANVIAQAMKKWAISKGATHYTHWFQPLTGLTAEKHDSFLDIDKEGQPIARFTGRQLIMSEPDASSFPHGGLRSTFEARGYAAWDATSPAFIMERADSATLCLPSVYVTYKGEVLDKKTPLLRSCVAVSKASVEMLRKLGNKRVTGVTPHVGAEQEYFLVEAELFDQRPDLREVGATLIGAGPARGQQLEDHYFRALNERILSFMEEAEQELMRLGVPVKTRHNEVAPAQFELAAIHQPANIAADQNQLVMEVLRRVAAHHGLRALLYEKPYNRVNGSGKHNNWSLIDSEGTNLLEPGTNQSSQMRFLIFLMAVVWGVERHSALLSGITASAGNDRRLGGNEAPPRVTSVHLGSHLDAVLDDLAEIAVNNNVEDFKEIDLGLGGVARIPRDTTDRNRTSPFAFTGNKFEFRAVGSSAAISLPNVVINSMVAESLEMMSERLERYLNEGETRPAAALKMLREVISEARACRFDGDCYSDEWNAEAQKRGLSAGANAPQSLGALVSESSLALFEKFNILNKEEVEARYRIKLDLYAKTIGVELSVAKQLLTTYVLPAATRYQKQLSTALVNSQAALGENADALSGQREHLKHITVLINRLIKEIHTLSRDENSLAENGNLEERAQYYANEVRPHLDAARHVSDQLEALIDHAIWPLPHIDDLLELKP